MSQTAAFVVVAGVMGLLVGSFLSVVIHRVPEGLSIVRPPSACPACGTAIRPRDNIPVVSWLVLRGRCRNCTQPISPRYPLVELLTGILFATMATVHADSWALPAFLVAVAAFVSLSAIDLERYILPRKIIYVSLGIAAAILVTAAAIEGTWDNLARAAVGAALAFATLFLIHIISPRGMGFGDVRLAALVGLVTGWLGLAHVALALFLSFLFASIIGVGLIVTKLRTRKDRVPFGPFLALGAFVALVAGRPILELYLR